MLVLSDVLCFLADFQAFAGDGLVIDDEIVEEDTSWVHWDLRSKTNCELSALERIQKLCRPHHSAV